MTVLLCLHSPGRWSFGDIATMLVSDWRSVASFSYIQAPISGVRSTFAMYSLRLVKFDNISYVQRPIGGPPIGGVWRCLLCFISNWWSLTDVCYVHPPIGGV
ncbi:hypothetical protein KY284_012719 [Solanum tuberosum]|nr:hypothetical protein KY284_012719 [Solanum tuberosum]